MHIWLLMWKLVGIRVPEFIVFGKGLRDYFVPLDCLVGGIY